MGGGPGLMPFEMGRRSKARSWREPWHTTVILIRIQMGQLTRIRIGNPDVGRPNLFHKKEKIKEVKKLKKTFQTVYKQKKIL